MNINIQAYENCKNLIIEKIEKEKEIYKKSKILEEITDSRSKIDVLVEVLKEITHLKYEI